MAWTVLCKNTFPVGMPNCSCLFLKPARNQEGEWVVGVPWTSGLHCSLYVVCNLSLLGKKAKPVHCRTGEIYGQSDCSRTAGSNVSPKCLTYITAESADRRNKPNSEKPLCLVVVAVRLGIARCHLSYLLPKIQDRQIKHISPEPHNISLP